jgi:nicotinate dehydrogenase subunit B
LQGFLFQVDRPSEKPWGAGEPTAAVVPAGDRQCDLRRDRSTASLVPFTPAEVLAALQKT